MDVEKFAKLLQIAHFYNVTCLVEIMERLVAESCDITIFNLAFFIKLATSLESQLITKAILQWKTYSNCNKQWKELIASDPEFFRLVGMATLDFDEQKLYRYLHFSSENIWIFWNEDF